MLFYPAGNVLQRGEDRCQTSINDSAVQAARACNDLGYAASMLRDKGFHVYLKDYQSESLPFETLVSDFKMFDPDAIFLSVTNSSILDDLQCVRALKNIKPNIAVVLKGALFFDPSEQLLKQLDLSQVDYLIGGESDFIIADLLHCHFHYPEGIPDINGIVYKQDGRWTKTDFSAWNEDLDGLKFPDRSLMNNNLYIRPDTGEPMATIATSRGCPASCIYCLTPRISGKKLRVRSPENIFMELKECYNKHGIRNFFFKSDTFTMDRRWVKELCDYIVSSELHGKIAWVANSRVNPIAQETLHYMKKAGCWLVAFGFESGSDESLKKMKKGATVKDNLRACAYAREAGLKVLGFFLIGLPWEDMAHLRATRRLMLEMNPDFIELHLAVPYEGTAYYDMAVAEGLLSPGEETFGQGHFSDTIGTKYLTAEEILRFKRRTLLAFYLRPSFIAKKVAEALVVNPRILVKYALYGIRIVRVNLFSPIVKAVQNHLPGSRASG